MGEFRTFHEGEPRPPTWAERDRLEEMRDRGVADVYVEPGDAAPEFWESLMVTVDYFLAPSSSSSSFAETWRAWEQETIFATGWRFNQSPRATFENIVRGGLVVLAEGTYRATTGQRFAAIEHLLDVQGGDAKFEERVNDRARWFRVGVRLEDDRFTPVTSEHLHTEVVRPTLLLLSQDGLSAVDGLYRKAFDRVLSGDPSGAITAAISAVEEMLRALLPAMKGQTLSPLAEKARADGIISSGVEEFIKKLYALRDESDAHQVGTSEFDPAMLAIHLTGSILLFLGRASSNP